MIRQEQVGFRSEQVFALVGISSSSARNGKHQCTLPLLTFRMLSTISSKRGFRTLRGSMASLTSLLGLLRHYTIGAQAASKKAEGVLSGLK